MKNSIILLSIILLSFGIVGAVEIGDENVEVIDRMDFKHNTADALANIIFDSGQIVTNTSWYFFEWWNQPEFGSDISEFRTSLTAQPPSIGDCINQKYGNESGCPFFSYDRSGLSVWPGPLNTMFIRRWFKKDFTRLGGTINFRLNAFTYASSTATPKENQRCGDASDNGFNESETRVVLWDINGKRSFGEWFNSSLCKNEAGAENPVTWWYRGTNPSNCLSNECDFVNESGWDESQIEMLSIEVRAAQFTGLLGENTVSLKVAIDEIFFIFTDGPSTINITTFYTDNTVFDDNKYVNFQAFYPDDINWSFKEILYSPDGFFLTAKAFSDIPGGGVVSYLTNTRSLASEFWIYYRGVTREDDTIVLKHHYRVNRNLQNCITVNVLENQSRTIILEAESILYDVSNNLIDTKTGGVVSFCDLNSGAEPFRVVSSADEYVSSSRGNISIGDAVDMMLWLGNPFVNIFFYVHNESGQDFPITPPSPATVNIINLNREVTTDNAGGARFFSVPRNIPINYIVSAEFYQDVKGSDFSDESKVIVVEMPRSPSFSESFIQRTPFPVLSEDEMEIMLKSYVTTLFVMAFLITLIWMVTKGAGFK